MLEKPLDRLNYYNGQRLEASDLKLEQEYHIRTRRWLNKSLYKPGIASGLDIRAENGTPNVIVSPGLALDSEGREILLLKEEHVFVPGKPHKMGSVSDAEVEGLYLTIRYNEKSIEEERNECIPKSTNGKNNGDRAAWGGPARIRAKPLFNWRDALPYESSGEIVLGEVELDDKCKAVYQINTGVRRYVGAASESKVRQYALEGEREVAFIPAASFPDPKAAKDVAVVGYIYFHVRGRQPNAVTLYLKAEDLSPLHYTELGRHTHSGSLSGDVSTKTLTSAETEHKHTLGTLVSAPEKNETFNDGKNDFTAHQHYLFGYRTNPIGVALKGDHVGFQLAMTGLNKETLGNSPLDPADTELEIRWGRHRHHLAVIDPATGDVTGAEGDMDKAGFENIHTHSLNGLSATISHTGVEDPGQPAKLPRTGKPFSYIYDLQISIDGKDQTAAIREQVMDSRPSGERSSWSRLGDGTATHPFADREKGTGPIKLDFLPGVSFTEGEHYLEFSVGLKPNGEANGGRILYNLYVE